MYVEHICPAGQERGNGLLITLVLVGSSFEVSCSICFETSFIKYWLNFNKFFLSKRKSQKMLTATKVVCYTASLGEGLAD
jgi:hypothetical protein